MVCNIQDKWKCSICKLREDKETEVVNCENLNQEDLDCSMPIQVRKIKERKENED